MNGGLAILPFDFFLALHLTFEDAAGHEILFDHLDFDIDSKVSLAILSPKEPLMIFDDCLRPSDGAYAGLGGVFYAGELLHRGQRTTSPYPFTRPALLR